MDFEKLGAFYLGKRIDADIGTQTDELVLYDAKDLTTHAVIIGMTGSGKTGLGIGLLEEAAIDKVPVIAIDPKGDMGNMLLAFPDLTAADFAPWVNERQALDQGLSRDELAAQQATSWEKGLASWGQDGARIARFKHSADAAIYTPGSSAGLPVSVLQSFRAPDAALFDDSDLYRERVQSTATGVLSLLGIDTDPLTSREHIFVSRILDEAWQSGKDLDIATLIATIQSPPFTRVGVMDINSFFPGKERFELAMRLNNLLAAPGFEQWMIGEPLDAARLLHTEDGKPRISVMSIAHLGDAERMFFVCMLLNEVIAWMRTQQGTSTLRAILYMDEIAGYLPPTANPPSKALFLTLLKQARAYGLGLVLATQNPVDLDYKALSNAGTWFIGRLQTERDKMRVMEGLEGANQGGEFDRPAMERTLAGLGKRRFLLHNVHEDHPVVFATRWVLSYLAGPMTRSQISQLMDGRRPPADAPAPADARQSAGTTDTVVLAPAISQYFAPGGDSDTVYYPRLVGAAELYFSNARYGVEQERQVLCTLELDDDGAAPDWDAAERHEESADSLLSSGADGARFADCPAAAADAKAYPAWQRDFSKWLRQHETIVLYRSKRYRLTSTATETEGQFRARLQQAANEQRDLAIGKIRKRYATKTTTLENRLLRAEQSLEREQQQASKKHLDTVVSFGTAILGAVLGRKRLSASTTQKIGTAVKSASSSRKEAGDVERARRTAEQVRADITELEAHLADEIAALDVSGSAQDEELTEIVVKAKTSDVRLPVFGLLWVPYTDRGDGRLQAAWR